MSDRSYRYVTSQEELDGALDALGTSVAVDSEFIWRNTYYPVAALYQLCDDGRPILIDALSSLRLGSLVDLLRSVDSTKILHDMRQDWRLFMLLLRTTILRCEDTQMACAFVSDKSSIGYGSAVFEYLGTELKKSETLSKWLTRPLTPEQLRYAADDVLYLPDLWDCLSARLESRGVKAWYQEEMTLLRAELEVADQEYYRRINGAERLPPEQLSILKRLCEWRDEVAKTKNLPRPWVVADRQLIEVSRTSELSRRSLEKTCGDETTRRHGNALLRVFWEGRAKLTEVEPVPKSCATRQVIAEIRKDLHPHLKRVADDLGMAVEFLAPAKAIAKCVNALWSTGSLPNEIGNWRRGLFGEQLACAADRIVFSDMKDDLVAGQNKA